MHFRHVVGGPSIDPICTSHRHSVKVNMVNWHSLLNSTLIYATRMIRGEKAQTSLGARVYRSRQFLLQLAQPIPNPFTMNT